MLVFIHVLPLSEKWTITLWYTCFLVFCKQNTTYSVMWLSVVLLCYNKGTLDKHSVCYFPLWIVFAIFHHVYFLMTVGYYELHFWCSHHLWCLFAYLALCFFFLFCGEFNRQHAKHNKQILYMNHANWMCSWVQCWGELLKEEACTGMLTSPPLPEAKYFQVEYWGKLFLFQLSVMMSPPSYFPVYAYKKQLYKYLSLWHPGWSRHVSADASRARGPVCLQRWHSLWSHVEAWESLR